uniref:ribonuclease E/G n=1 Tax=Nocardia pseudovaccinii TaxID=189540 RepID=UPI000A43C9AA
YRIDEQLAKALDRKVWLPSGGTLVIDRTEAMTVIDVNTGKFTGAGGSNLEETVTRNNLEAAEEIVRQMRLRDIGGMIVVDFIDMVLESNRDLVLRRLTEALGRDRTRHQVSEVTSLGLVQMTRKKLGTGLVEAFSTTCEHCHGRGIVVHTYPVELTGAEDSTRSGRETGSRRRRGRDKGAAASAPAAAANGTAHAVEDEAEIAVKRAHPVALAMAAHQSEEVHAEDVAELEDVAVAEAVADVVAASDEAPVADVVVAESVAAVAEEAAEAVAEEVAEAVTEEAAEAVAEEVAEAVTEEAAEAEVVAEEAVASASEEVAPVAAAASTPAADEPAEPAVEPVAASSNGVPDSAAPRSAGRRRRVARSAAAPAADSAGAVFVLPTADQGAAGPVVDYTADVPVVVPSRKPRRRAVGRPAGPPVDDAN